MAGKGHLAPPGGFTGRADPNHPERDTVASPGGLGEWGGLKRTKRYTLAAWFDFTKRKMSRSEEIRAIIARLYAARKSGDLNAILRFFHENASFAMNGSKQASGVAMEAKGADEIRAALTNLLDAYDMHEQTILSFLVDDEKAAVHHRSKLKFKPTGEVFDTEMLDLWKLDGDKVVSVIEFVDTALARDHLMQAK